MKMNNFFIPALLFIGLPFVASAYADTGGETSYVCRLYGDGVSSMVVIDTSQENDFQRTNASKYTMEIRWVKQNAALAIEVSAGLNRVKSLAISKGAVGELMTRLDTTLPEGNFYAAGICKKSD